MVDRTKNESKIADLLIGVSPWAEGMRSEIARAAAHTSNVLIIGPTGTGKELIARAIHAASPRALKPFVPVDSAAAGGPLFASHVFGHVRGAFTGASSAVPGCFRAAEGGTIFLDEMGELELEFQSKLLRVLQERTVTPLGSHREIPVDARVIAATHCDLANMVAAGRFREDLYYRLNVITLKTIPLRDRPEDIEVLAWHILGQLAERHGLPPKQLSHRCLECLREHEWHGNVRELANYLERASLLMNDEDVCTDALFDLLHHRSDSPRAVPKPHSSGGGGPPLWQRRPPAGWPPQTGIPAVYLRWPRSSASISDGCWITRSRIVRPRPT